MPDGSRWRPAWPAEEAAGSERGVGIEAPPQPEAWPDADREPSPEPWHDAEPARWEPAEERRPEPDAPWQPSAWPESDGQAAPAFACRLRFVQNHWPALEKLCAACTESQ